MIQKVGIGRNSSSSSEEVEMEEEADSSGDMMDINQMIHTIAGPHTQNMKDMMEQGGSQQGKGQPVSNLMPEEKAERLIQEAEKSKGQIFANTGNYKKFDVVAAKEMIHSVLVDEEYSSVGSHLDEATVNKIKRGEYVDFAKLLPRDRLSIEEDNHLQPIFKDG